MLLLCFLLLICLPSHSYSLIAEQTQNAALITDVFRLKLRLSVDHKTFVCLCCCFCTIRASTCCSVNKERRSYSILNVYFFILPTHVSVYIILARGGIEGWGGGLTSSAPAVCGNEGLGDHFSVLQSPWTGLSAVFWLVTGYNVVNET